MPLQGQIVIAAEPFKLCQNTDYEHTCKMQRIVRNNVLNQAVTTVTNCIGSLQGEMVKDSKEAAAKYRYMYKYRCMYKYIRIQIELSLR
jgi:hypothetical protein